MEERKIRLKILSDILSDKEKELERLESVVIPDLIKDIKELNPSKEEIYENALEHIFNLI